MKIEDFISQFDAVVETVQRYSVFVRASEYQQESIAKLEILLGKCVEYKDGAIIDQDNDLANAFMAFEYMVKAMMEEFKFYLSLKEDWPAWENLIQSL